MEDPVSVVWIVVLAVVLASLVEGFVEYFFGTLFDKIPSIGKYKWTLMYVSAAAGVALAFYYSVDLIALAVNMAGATQAPTIPGIIFTGFIIGRGANYINDFVSRWLTK